MEEKADESKQKGEDSRWLARVTHRLSSFPHFGIVLIAGAFLLVNALYWFSVADSYWSLIFSLTTIVLFLLAYFLYARNSNEEPNVGRWYLMVLCCSGLVYCMVFTPMTVPDERYHFQASYELSNALMGSGYPSSITDVSMRKCDAEFTDDCAWTVQRSDYEVIAAEMGTFFCDSEAMVSRPVDTGKIQASQNPIQLKLPSALGITLARLLHLGPCYLFYLGRLFNFSLFAVLVYLAWRVSPIGKNVIVATSLLPMTLHLAASYSYDAGTIGLAILLTSLCLRAIFRTNRLSAREAAEIIITAALLAPCKLIYTPIVCLVFFIPARRFSSKRNEIVYKFGSIALVFASLVVIRLPDLLNIAQAGAASNTLDVRGSATGHFYTVSQVLDEPIRFIIMLVRTLDQYGAFYLEGIVGGSLGWFQSEIALPGYWVLLLYALLGYALLASDEDSWQPPLSVRVVGLLLCTVAVLGVFLSMLVGHTFDTEQIIMGVQGRYALPILPLLLICIRPLRIRVEGKSLGVVVLSSVFINAAILTRIFSIALTL
ncbi:MAG: DUF2142 domain-containing protein [Coriobacteriales bacterium]|jgi:uncharacterized membrane protein